MVGEAFTLRYIPSREDIDVSSAFEDRDHPQRKTIETIPAGHVLVMDCRQDRRDVFTQHGPRRRWCRDGR